MEMMCEVHRKIEMIEQLPGGFIRFECGMARKETEEEKRFFQEQEGNK